MKRSIFLLVFFLLVFSHVYAQPPARLKKVLVSTYPSNVGGYTPLDSTVYYYSGNNQGHLANEIFFNTIKQDNWGATLPWVRFNDGYSVNLHFNPGLHYDSAIKYALSRPGVPKHLGVLQDIVNGNILDATTVTYSNNQWLHYWTSSFSYSGGQLISRTDSGKSGIGHTTYNYFNGSNGAPDSLVIVIPNKPPQKITYKYNNGMPIERVYYSGYGTLCKTLYSYQGNGLLTAEMMVYYDSTISIWDTVGSRGFSYNASNQLIQEKRWRGKGTSGSGWLVIDISYDSNNNRVEDILHVDWYKNTGLIKLARKQYGYNSFGLIDDYEVTYWDDSLQTWRLGADSFLFNSSQKVTLEYEAHWPQDVSTINTTTSGVTIFPSPASGFITVKAEEIPAGKLEAAIYDMHGHLLRKWADESNGVYSRTIPVQELPAGNYILQLNGKETNRSEKFVIYR